jgi:hypothetical protein
MLSCFYAIEGEAEEGGLGRFEANPRLEGP